VIDSNGVLQPYKHLGWWKWMYRVTPYTYIVEGMIGQGEPSLFPFHLTLIDALTTLQRLAGMRLPARLSNMSRSIHRPD
jgi:hypothetical protein